VFELSFAHRSMLLNVTQGLTLNGISDGKKQVSIKSYTYLEKKVNKIIRN